MASAKNQRLAVEELALWRIAKVECHDISSSLVVDALQSLVRDGYELALVVGGSRRLGLPFYVSWPEDVALAVTHTVYISLQLLVSVEGDVPCKILITIDGAEKMVAPVFGSSAPAHKVSQNTILYIFGVMLVFLHLFLPWNK